MKVVELADELGLTMFEILDLCDRIGIDAVNGASDLPERDASRLRRLFGAGEPAVTAEAMQPEATPEFPAVTLPSESRPAADLPSLVQVPQRRRSDRLDREQIAEPASREPGRSDDRSPATEKPAPAPALAPARAAHRRDESSEDSTPTRRSRSRGPAPEAREETSDRSSRDRRTGPALVRWLIPVAVAAAVVAIGAVLLGGGATTSAPDGDPRGALAVEAGTCFNATEGSTITEVGVVECGRSHVAEVFLVAQHPARADEAYPGSDQLAEAGLARCTEPFEAYVGEPLGSSNLVIAVTHPTESSWVERGDRTLVCSVVDAGGAALESSVAAEG